MTLTYQTNASGAPSTNRINSDSQGYNYSYDSAGNMTTGMGQSYSYDGANRLKEVGTGGANVYGYDGDGKRVKKTESGTTTYYVYSSKLGQSVMEVTASSVQRAYVYGGGKLVAMQATDGQFYWLHTNHLGNSRAMTDTSGNLTYKGQFDPYGAALTEWSALGNTNLNSKKFTGYERDSATGLDYAQARMYNSLRGRFLTPDPIGLKSSDTRRPGSLNLYSYAQNDPVNFVDPEGTNLYEVSCTMVWFGDEKWREVCVVRYKAPDDRSGGGDGSDQRGGRNAPKLKRSVIAPPKAIAKCGEAFAEFEFEIENRRPGVNGVVIQEIHKVSVVMDKDGNEHIETLRYWESWEVKDGYVYTPYPDRVEPIGRDQWGFEDRPTTKGTVIQTGWAKFILNGTGIDPNASDRHPNSGRLPSTQTMPSGWSRDGAIVDDMEAIWDCTTSPPADPKVT